MTIQTIPSRILVVCCVFVQLAVPVLQAGVRKEIEAQYEQQYKNKAMFVKIPVRGERQVIYPSDSGLLLDRSNLNQPLWFKVGDQIRITSLNFRDNSIEFEVASIDLTRRSRIIFQFPTQLRTDFPEQPVFDAALRDTFTEGLSYREIDSAKEQFIKDQFDQLIDQFAKTTNTSSEFVVQAISEKNPEFQTAKRKLADVERQLGETMLQLDQEKKAGQAFQLELTRMRRELAETRDSQVQLQRERDSLLGQRSKLQKEVSELQDQIRRQQAQSRDLEAQINALAAGLDLKTSGNVELGKQVESLGKSIDSLKTDRETLSGKLASLSRQLESLQKSNEKLNAEFSEAQEHNVRLQGELRDLTANRNSLEARYLETKRRKEILEMARQLNDLLRVERRYEERNGVELEKIDVYLDSHKFGEMELDIPQYAGGEMTVRYLADSPELVRFSDEERRLYKALGENIKLRLDWSSWTGRIKPVPVKGEAVQMVAPRESVEWVWSIPTSLAKPERLSLTAKLIDSNEQPIHLFSQDFEVRPSGFLSRLADSFWIPSLLGGLLLGSGLGIVASRMRNKERRREKTVKRGPEYVVQKKL